MPSVEIRTINGKTQLVVVLPVLEVGSPDEAHVLLAFTCSTDTSGRFTARELEQEITKDNFIKFQQRMADAYAVMKHKRRKKK